MIAAQILKLAGSCDFFTALGDDELGHASVARLEELGLTLHVEWFGVDPARAHARGRQRRADDHHGRPEAPAERAASARRLRRRLLRRRRGEALRSARAARFLAATPRELPWLLEGGVHLDLLVGSGTDPGERYDDGTLDVGVVVRTEGARGGTADGRRFEAQPLPAPVVDTYGAGDSFGAALCFALARGDDLDDALALAGRAGAAVVTGRGPYAAQLVL